MPLEHALASRQITHRFHPIIRQSQRLRKEKKIVEEPTKPLAHLTNLGKVYPLVRVMSISLQRSTMLKA